MNNIKEIINLMKIPVTEKLIIDVEKDIEDNKKKLPSANWITIQNDIAFQSGYLSGLKMHLEELKSLRDIK